MKPISIVALFPTFSLACITYYFRNGVVIWILKHYVTEILANVFNSRLSADDKSTPITVSVSKNDGKSREPSRSYPEAVHHYLTKLATGQSIAKVDAVIIHSMQLWHITPLQCVNGLAAKSCKVADVYDDATLNEVFLYEIDVSTRQSM